MKKIFFQILLFPLLVNGQSSNLEWAFSIGTGYDDFCHAMVLDKDENVYITGHFRDTIDLDPGNGAAIHVSKGDYDIYLAKYTSNGAYLWSKSMGSTKNDFSHDMVIDSNQNIYFTGQHDDNIDFDPGPGQTLLDGYAPYVCSFDSAGNFNWAESIDSLSLSKGNSLDLSDDGFLYITGSPTFIAKYSTSGVKSWAKKFENSTTANEIKVDPFNQILITGYFSDTLTFKQGDPLLTLDASGNAEDIFICKHDQFGSPIWAKQLGGLERDEAISMDCDSGGGIYISGQFRDQVDFDPNSGVHNVTALSNGEDVFILKLNITGSFEWVTPIATDNPSLNHHLEIMNKELYVSGLKQDTILNTDVGYLYKIDGSGNIDNRQHFRGTPVIQDFEMGKYGNIYCAGQYSGSVDFDTGPEEYVLTSSTSGNTDIFALKLAEELTAGINKENNSVNLSIYPNPTIDEVTVQFDALNQQGSYLKIYDQQGQLIHAERMSNAIETIDLPESPGLYIFNLVLDDGTRFTQLVIKE